MKRCLLCLAVVCEFFVGNPLRATSLNVDFGVGSGNVQAGFNNFSFAATATGESDQNTTSQTMTYSGIGVTITAPDAGYANGGGEVFTEYRDRGAVNGTGLDNLLRDFVFARGGNLTLTLSGLPAGLYEMTTFHHDPQFAQAGFSAITVNNGSGPVTVATSIPVTTGFSPSSFSTETFNFTATDGNETVVFVSGGGVSFPILNGFELLSVPEPSTFLLTALAAPVLCLVGARYRRSRSSTSSQLLRHERKGSIMNARLRSMFTSLGAKSVAQAVGVALTAGLMLMAETAGAAIIGTYVDAQPGVNTAPTTAFNTVYDPAFTSGLWNNRPLFGLNTSGALAPTQNVVETGATSFETVPTITTTVTGLTPTVYDVYVLYWSPPASDWTVQAKLSSDASYQEYGRVGSSHINGTDTGITQSGIDLYEAHIGTVSGTSIAVNILNSTVAGERSWYDGIAYVGAPVPEPSSLFLCACAAGACALIGVRRRSVK